MHERFQVNIKENQSDANGSGAKALGGLQDPGGLPEALSALMDGEAGQLELRRVLRALDSDDGNYPACQAGTTGAVSGEQPDGQAAALLARWRRYHLVQASLHAEVTLPRSNLLPGIHARLEAEGLEGPQISWFGSQARGLAGRLARPLARASVAASVAAAVLFGASQVDQRLREETPAAGSVATRVADAGEAALLPELGGEYNPSSLTRTVSMGAAERDRIQRAVQQFSGQAPAVLFNEAYTFPVQPQPGEQDTAAQQAVAPLQRPVQ